MTEVLVLQPAEDDPLGRLGARLDRAGVAVDLVSCQQGQLPPASLSGYDGLVVLGGGHGAYDDDAFPGFPAIKSLLRQAVSDDVPTLAVCLGHQLLAVATGGRVVRAPSPQLGVLAVPVTVAAAADPLFAGLPRTASAVHWNNDVVVEVPAAAVALAWTDIGLQAAPYRTRVWGVQFHPEVDVETVATWARADVAAGLLAGEHGQRRVEQVRAAAAEHDLVWSAFADRFLAQLQQTAGAVAAVPSKDAP